jgi:alkylhydroperoxidase family enzyme
VSQTNGCNYCLAAHTFASSTMTRMTDDDIALGRSGSSTDPKRAAAARFAQELVNSRGRVSDAELAAIRDAGYSDPQILAIVALSVSFLLTNYLNNVIETDIDLPFTEGTAA